MGHPHSRHRKKMSEDRGRRASQHHHDVAPVVVDANKRRPPHIHEVREQLSLRERAELYDADEDELA
jgi:hypothetical protein